MSRVEKLCMRVASSPANTRFEDLVRLAEAVGFVRDRISGSHRFLRHPDYPREVLNLQAEHGRAKQYQVAQLLDLIDRLQLRRW